MPSRVILPALALAGVLLSVGMVLVGLPEANAAQSVLLELSSLPLSASVGIGVLILHRRAVVPIGRRSRVVLVAGGALVAFGLVLMAWAYAVGPRDVVHTGQLLVWLGLLAALLVMIRRQPRQRASRLDLLDPAPDDDADDPSADPGRTPSL